MGLFDGSRKAKRRQARLDRIALRQEGKTSRQQERSDARTAAYKAGIDPNAFISDTVTSVADVAKSFAAPIPGGGLKAGSAGSVTTDEGGGDGSGLGKLLPIVGAVVLFMLIKKR